MNLKNRIIAFAAATAIIVPVAAFGAFTVKKDGDTKSVAKVSARLPTGVIDCSSDDVTIADNGTDLTVNVGLGKLKTGIGMRDGHFRKRMKELGAALTVKTSDVKGKKSGTIPGQLKINGVTRPVQVTFNTEDKGKFLKVTGKVKDLSASVPTKERDDVKKEERKKVFGINHRDFKIGESFCEAGMCVADDLWIEADLLVNKD